MNQKLGQVFIDGQSISLDNSSSDILVKALVKLRKERCEKINNIAKIIKNLQNRGEI